MGDIEVNKRHVLSKANGHFAMSAYLQNLCCYEGANAVFETASATLHLMLGIDVTAKQIERISHFYGEEMGKLQDVSPVSNTLPETSKQPSQPSQVYYAMMDGAMIFTREDGWKEVKLGRGFSAAEHIKRPEHKRNLILQSEYIGHIGTHTDFLEKFDRLIQPHAKEAVFVCDGAPWIWNWVDDHYLRNTQILDYFHAKEHLCEFAESCFDDKKAREKWIKEQENLLLKDAVKQVINNILQLPLTTEMQQKKQKALVNYYQTNAKRMIYGSFRKRGLLIGSGPIEAANKTVIQQRLKLSGQRWTLSGAQQILNLRTTFFSNQQQKLLNCIKMAA
ncbi:hypothetical protein AGMMS49982_00750 [Bacteroidia bacterium]|nr:hypothetical protein AGMMS49982_00750 [Bacteroidia bacterium]